METKKLVQDWFKKWEAGDFNNLPVAESFSHTSPFGTIVGKIEYLNLVTSNKDKFLGYQFIIVDEIYHSNKACVRYKAIQNDFRLDVSEWYYINGNLIEKIIAYYHIGEVREERKLK